MTNPAEEIEIAVIGAGPAGLMAAETLAEAGCHVIVYDQMRSFGRKLLMAGVGGLNLTHSEGLEAFQSRYRGMSLGSMVEAFPPEALRAWCEGRQVSGQAPRAQASQLGQRAPAARRAGAGKSAASSAGIEKSIKSFLCRWSA